MTKRKSKEKVPDDPYMAFAFFVSKCCSGFGGELIRKGRTATQARNVIIGLFLDFASGEACRIARRDGREPDAEKWRKATTKAFDRAVKRTAKQAKETAADSGFSKAEGMSFSRHENDSVTVSAPPAHQGVSR